MWKHKKYKSSFKGQYARLEGERVFNLKGVVSNKPKTITYESFWAAKRDGWVKVGAKKGGVNE